MLLLNATLPDGTRADVELRGDRIARITPAGATGIGATVAVTDAGAHRLDGREVVDLSFYALLPAFVNGHAHLDKTFVGAAWQPHREGGSVRARIARERALLADLHEPVEERAGALAALMIESGTGTVRTHVDIDPIIGLSRLDALLSLRDELAGKVRMQIVAFPQSGVLGEGTAALLEEAVARGADAVGAVDPIDLDGDAERALDTVFGIASRHGVGVDIHLHAVGAEAVDEYALILDRTRRHGLDGRVAIAHAPGLAALDASQFDRVVAALAASGVAVMTPGPAGAMPPVAALREAGVTVFAGTDNVRDAWHPFGDGDMLGIARQLAFESGFRADDQLASALDVVTTAGAAALGLPDVRVREGGPADLVAVAADSAAAAVAAPPASRLTIHGGRVVARRVLTVSTAQGHPAPTLVG